MMIKIFNHMRGRAVTEKAKQPPSPPLAKPLINSDAELVKKEKQQIEAYSSKRYWLRQQKFGW